MNMLEEVTPKLLAMGLLALRAECVMPRAVNTDYGSEAARQGETISVPIPSVIPVNDVVPGPNAPTTKAIAPTSASIPMNQWKEAPFFLTDKDMKTAMDGIIPMQASAAISSLADAVDTFIFEQYKGVYGFVGTAGVTPFDGDTKIATDAGKVLNIQRAGKANRRMVIDPTAEAAAKNLRAFQDASFNGSTLGIEEGMINRKLGFDWVSDQNVLEHETGAAGPILVNQGNHSEGDASVIVDGQTAAPIEGDVFTVAGDEQTYVVNSFVNNAINYSPAAKEAWANDSALTFKANHIVNLGFHRDAFAFVTRPLESEGLGNNIMSELDPVSGLTLRLEISREHKQVRFSYDILFGAALLRPELAVRVAG